MSVFAIKPSPLTESTRDFLIPPTIISDYENYLMTEVPNAVFDFRRLRSWYDVYDDEQEPYMLRAEYFPINWKSKVGNSDMNMNFYASPKEDIQKGDIVIREDGKILMLNWNIQHYINSKTTQAIECNHTLSVVRHISAKADKRGYIEIPAHDETIVEEIPCVMSEYAGRPEYAVAQNAPGIHADMLSICDVQYNDQTMNIEENDQFVYGKYTYRVIHIDQTQVEENGIDLETKEFNGQPFGIIRLYTRKVAGEDK